jgi:hypothetical protein
MLIQWDRSRGTVAAMNRENYRAAREWLDENALTIRTVLFETSAIARMLGVPTRAVNSAIRRGELSACRVGSQSHLNRVAWYWLIDWLTFKEPFRYRFYGELKSRIGAALARAATHQGLSPSDRALLLTHHSPRDFQDILNDIEVGKRPPFPTLRPSIQRQVAISVGPEEEAILATAAQVAGKPLAEYLYEVVMRDAARLCLTSVGAVGLDRDTLNAFATLKGTRPSTQYAVPAGPPDPRPAPPRLDYSKLSGQWMLPQ